MGKRARINGLARDLRRKRFQELRLSGLSLRECSELMLKEGHRASRSTLTNDQRALEAQYRQLALSTHLDLKASQLMKLEYLWSRAIADQDDARALSVLKEQIKLTGTAVAQEKGVLESQAFKVLGVQNEAALLQQVETLLAKHLLPEPQTIDGERVNGSR